jgi:hypothetical protein
MTPANGRATVPARPVPPDVRLAARIAALQAAATFAAGKCLGGDPATIKTADVLRVARAFEQWLLERSDQP